MPEHVAVHTENNAMVATEEESFIRHDGFITAGDGSGVYRFRVGTCGALLNDSGRSNGRG